MRRLIEMTKKLFIGWLLVSITLFGGCSSDWSATTNSSLEEEVVRLKTENSKLKKELAADKTTNNENQTGESARSKQEVKTFSNNEAIEFGDGEKKLAEMKIVEASTKRTAFPKRMQELENYNVERMVAVKIEYKNIDMDAPFLPYAQSFQAYSKDGKRLTPVNQQKGQDEVPKGKSGTTQIYWKLPVEGSEFNEFEIDFVSGDQRVAIFDLKVSH
ncbi:hypothetical protein [Enterococcus raffinosus]|uniref:hypothetical protein n=1 Tax=Enterococcus raffinosus TaxID=71452 RepID=UPI0021BBE6ED|nr:hypothetical protein [Enterococcus raffinosus]